MPEENKKDDQAPKDTTAEDGVQYVGDGTVVGDNDRLGGEESLAPPPKEFVQYGGPSQIPGSGLRSPGPFRAKYQLASQRFSNLISIPYRRVG